MVDDITNPSFHKKVYKRKACRETGKCSRCPWHGGENVTRFAKNRSWKKKRKSKWKQVPKV